LKLTGIKYSLLLLPLLMGGYNSVGQRRGFDNLTHFDDRNLHFGFYLGLNTMDYRLKNYKDVAENPVFRDNPLLLANTISRYGGKTSLAAEIYNIMPGFTVGGVVNSRLGRDFDLRFTPGMSLGNRHFKLIGIDNPSVDPGIDLKTYLFIPSAYLDLPIGIRYKGFRHRNLRPYVYTGAAFRQDLESQKRITEGVVHLKKSGGYAEVALGLDSYLEYFRFTAEFRFSYGLNNLIRHDTTIPIPYYGYMFKELNSNLFTLIFYFE
jgi:Outer membrane protein beta-barrel domain